MKLAIDNTSERFRAAILNFIRHQKVSVAEGMRIQGRLLAEQIVKFTPPKDKKQGEAAVERDINRVFNPLDPDNFKPSVARLIRSGDWEALQAFIDRIKTGPLVNKRVIAFTAALHRQNQASRGRVHKELPYVTAEVDAVRDYIRSVKKHVGQGRGGWASAVEGLGGKASKWVSRHAGSGELIDRADALSPSIEMINKSEWAKGGDEGRIVQNAIRSRIEKIEKSIAIKQAQAMKKAGIK